MLELTKEYLDKKLDSQTKDIKSYVNDRFSSIEEKIEAEVRSLETKIESEVADLARMTVNGFEEIKRELDVKKEVESLSHRMVRIEQALNIKH